MTSTFMGLEIARRGLAAAQTSLDVTGQNVSNASTSGYTRQRAEQVASDPYTIPSLGSSTMAGQMGTGVTVEQIKRIRDSYLDTQYREQNSLLGQYQIGSQTLSAVQTLFTVSSSNGTLNSLLDGFFNTWQELSKDAQSSPIRTSLVDSAATLCAAFNNMSNQLSTEENDLAVTGSGVVSGTDLLSTDVAQVNKIASQINSLNTQIMKVKAIGEQPNDLLDKRDLLLDQLSKLMNINVTQENNDGIKVTIGDNPNAVLITTTASATVNTLSASATSGFTYNLYNASGSLITSASGSISNMGGELEGIKNVYNDIVSYKQKLDTLAGALISQVNSLHQSGYTLTTSGSAGSTLTIGSAGGTFFVGSSAATIQVNSALSTYPNMVAAASAGATSSAIGSAGIALAIADLQNSAIATLNGATLNGYYQSTVSSIGSDAQKDNNQTSNQQTLVDQVNNLRQSTSGVNLDEELTNLIQYQHSYEAAAKVITVQDSLLNTSINVMAV